MSPIVKEHKLFDDLRRHSANRVHPEDLSGRRQRSVMLFRPHFMRDHGVSVALDEARLTSVRLLPVSSSSLRYATRCAFSVAVKGTIPILIVTGPHDATFAPEMMRLRDAELPTSRLLEIPDTSHSPYFERPDAWNRAVVEHLGG